MKKSMLAVAVLALCAVSTARAQGFGILGGVAFGSVPTSSGVLPGNMGTLSANNGFAVGVAAETGGFLGFGINGLYAQRGFTSSNAGFSQKFNYIDVPVYLKISIVNPAITPFAFVGPQASFELKCDAGGGGQDCPSGRPKVTYAGVIGAGLKFGMLAGISVQGRYVYGLTDLNLTTVGNANSYQTRSFMLLAGIGF
jgi:Outer membrane protein beta-barrel domain